MSKLVSAKDLIRTHQLTSHPEGRYYRETYRSHELIPSPAFPPRYWEIQHHSSCWTSAGVRYGDGYVREVLEQADQPGK
jgi:hypothetical protein